YGDAAAKETPPPDTSREKDKSERANFVARKGEASKLLTALGVPNDKGAIDWPLGLQVLLPQSKTNELLDRIETLLQVAAIQQIQGQVNGNLVEETKTAVDDLHAMLRERHNN